jgi:hypothetical protein
MSSSFFDKAYDKAYDKVFKRRGRMELPRRCGPPVAGRPGLVGLFAGVSQGVSLILALRKAFGTVGTVPGARKVR